MQWVPNEKKEQPEQEPDDLTIAYMTGFHAGKNKDAPQRKWVGLTDEEKESFWRADQMTQKEWGELFTAIEAKLREKNGIKEET